MIYMKAKTTPTIKFHEQNLIFQILLTLIIYQATIISTDIMEIIIIFKLSNSSLSQSQVQRAHMRRQNTSSKQIWFTIEINELEVFVQISKTDVGFGNNQGRWLFILSRWLFRNNHPLRRLLIGWKHKAMIKSYITDIAHDVTLSRVPTAGSSMSISMILSDKDLSMPKS